MYEMKIFTFLKQKINKITRTKGSEKKVLFGNFTFRKHEPVKNICC